MGCCSESLRKSTCVVVVIVFLGLLSDSMLLTLVGMYVNVVIPLFVDA